LLDLTATCDVVDRKVLKITCKSYFFN
jgi:hypothetical protein